jgi:probable HAF family extracellular repeat protein
MSMNRPRLLHLVLLAALALGMGLATGAPLSAAAAATTTTYTITDLGSLGFGLTVPTAVNASGQATGYSNLATAIPYTCKGHYKPPRTCYYHAERAFVWSNGTMTDLGTLGTSGTTSSGSAGNAINASGEVAGWTNTATAGVLHAALWTGTTTVDLGALAPLSAGSWSIANGINDSGQVTGYWATSGSQIINGSHPWLYSNGTMTSLPVPSNLTAPSCDPLAINNNGQIIGSCATNNGATSNAVLWQNGTVTTLGTLGGLQVHDLTGINNNGQIVGWADTSTGTTVGFLDSNGTVTDLGAFLPQAINDNGVIIGGDQIYSGGTVQNLNNLIPANSGYTITEAFGINDNGQIIAQASDATTSEAAVLLTPN